MHAIQFARRSESDAVIAYWSPAPSAAEAARSTRRVLDTLRERGTELGVHWELVVAGAAGGAPESQQRSPEQRWVALLDARIAQALRRLPAVWPAHRRWLVVHYAGPTASLDKVAAGLALARLPVMADCLARFERAQVLDARDLWSFARGSFGFRTLRAEHR